MRVGMDLTSLLYRRGVSRFTFDLFRELTTLEEVEMYAYASCGSRAQQAMHTALNELAAALTPSARENFWTHTRVQGIPTRVNHWLWHYLRVNKIKKQLPEIELFHTWDFLQPPDKNIPLVSTIHDLAMWRFPETADKRVWRHHRESWEILRQRGAHVTVDSAATKRDVLEFLDWPEARVHLVYAALPSQVKTAVSESVWKQVQQEWDLRRPYLLFVGTREPRKNLARLVSAWEKLAADVDLVIVGARGWGKQTRAQAHLHVCEGVGDEMLTALYIHARALVFPSLYEGFGLPILESFAHGTPVVTSRGNACEEIGGAAAVLVEPLEVESIRAGIETILAENETEKQVRRQLMTQQLARFSWARAARETAAVYRLAWEEFYG